MDTVTLTSYPGLYGRTVGVVEISLASHEPECFLNIGISDTARGKGIIATISAKDAMNLRDELLKIYPLSTPSVYDETKPKVGDIVDVKPMYRYLEVFRTLQAPLKVVDVGVYRGSRTSIHIEDQCGKKVSGMYAHRYRPYDRADATPVSPKKDFIVSLLTSAGKPAPANRPVTHTNAKLALAEADRLANVHVGQTFAVYEKVAEVVTPKGETKTETF